MDNDGENNKLDKKFKSNENIIRNYQNKNKNVLFDICARKYMVSYGEWKSETVRWKSDYNKERIFDLEGTLKGLIEIFEDYFVEMRFENVD